jgi:hypothetical protein
LRNIEKVNLTFLQDIRSWIWAPKNVSIYGSLDNKVFEFIETVSTKISDRDENVQVVEMAIPLKNNSVKYVKVVAENLPKIPDWHLGAGNKAHIFVSEVEMN